GGPSCPAMPARRPCPSRCAPCISEAAATLLQEEAAPFNGRPPRRGGLDAHRRRAGGRRIRPADRSDPLTSGFPNQVLVFKSHNRLQYVQPSGGSSADSSGGPLGTAHRLEH